MNEEKKISKNRFMELCRSKPCYIITLSLLCVHLVEEVLFLAFKCWPMAGINLVSIGIYTFTTACYDQFLRKTHVKIILGEVLAFSLIAVILYGDNARYSINVIPLILVMCCWDYDSKYVHKDSTERTRVQVSIICIVVVYIVEKLMDALHLYVGFSLSAQHTTILSLFNCAISLMGILMSTFIWWNLTDYTAGLLEESFKKSDYLANHDSLTGLRNRESMDKHIIELEQKKQEYALILADIDDFKHFNDKFGHDCGDEVLKKVARMIHRYVRSEDHTYRWGGEEIVIILTAVDRQLAEKKAADICQAIAEKEFVYDGSRVSITVTMGVTVSQGQNSQEVMKEADQLLFKGKELGKNCAVGIDGVIKNDRKENERS